MCVDVVCGGVCGIVCGLYSGICSVCMLACGIVEYIGMHVVVICEYVR